MHTVKYRKHPRVYTKKHSEEADSVLTVSAAAAVGILAFTLAKGFFWGYTIKKMLNNRRGLF